MLSKGVKAGKETAGEKNIKGDRTMHKGVFKGDHLSMNQNMLIHGESHHHAEPNDLNYTTESVVKNYFSNPNDPAYRFFDKIAACFGFSASERERFWSQVWFGNYVDESDCGIGDNKAIELVKKNRDTYNRELFEFVNQNGIDIIFCFSRLVYNNLPGRASFEDKAKNYPIPDICGKPYSDYIRKFIYKPGARANNDVELYKPLTVYGFRHPSSKGGFNYAHYMDYLKEEIQF